MNTKTKNLNMVGIFLQIYNNFPIFKYLQIFFDNSSIIAYKNQTFFLFSRAKILNNNEIIKTDHINYPNRDYTHFIYD